LRWAFIFLFLVLPLAAVFTEALRKGCGRFFEAFKEPDAWSAIRLTLLIGRHRRATEPGVWCCCRLVPSPSTSSGARRF